MSDKERDSRRERVDGKEAAQGIGNNSKFRSTVRSLMYGLDSFISAKTVLGDPITIGDTIILPLVDVSFGVGAGSFGANTQNTDGNSGGGLHGKDLSKADVSVNIHAFLKAQRTGKPVELCCAIGDDTVDGIPYADIVEEARGFIRSLGGFEKFAEWGLF